MVLHPSTRWLLWAAAPLCAECQVPDTKEAFFGWVPAAGMPLQEWQRRREWFFQTSRVWREACAQGAGDVFGCVPWIFRLEPSLGQPSAGVAHGTKRGF